MKVEFAEESKLSSEILNQEDHEQLDAMDFDHQPANRLPSLVQTPQDPQTTLSESELSAARFLLNLINRAPRAPQAPSPLPPSVVSTSTSTQETQTDVDMLESQIHEIIEEAAANQEETL